MNGKGQRFAAETGSEALLFSVILLCLGLASCKDGRLSGEETASATDVETDAGDVTPSDAAEVPDDVPDALAECAEECGAGSMCNDGVCVTACADDTDCQWSQRCDGFCYEISCSTVADCRGENDPCVERFCEDRSCRYTLHYGRLPDDQPGNCWVPNCFVDGIYPATDEDDVPPDDGVACTVETCDAGAPLHLPDDSRCADDDPLTEHRCDRVEGCVEVRPP
ncbi:MAG: hypothetical protein ACJAYU_001617 [Bradymonadia bacterium]|jgi:hypothetical protein